MSGSVDVRYFVSNATWAKAGMNNLKLLFKNSKIHENSAKHVKNVNDLATLRKINTAIAYQLIDAYRQQTNIHNEKMRQNQEILSKIIDYKKLELPLSGHEENS